MELQSGFPLLWQQYSALFEKNFILSWRNKRATFLQLFSSFFFIFLMFCIDKVTESQEKNDVVTASDVKDPQGIYSPPIPPCEDKVLVKKPCYDFVWSGSGNQRIEKIVDAIMANNPRRKIPKHKVKSFKTKDEVDKYLFKNPLITPGALHFKERNNSVISYGLQTSPTPSEISKGRGDYEDPTLKYQIPLQIAAEREIARSLIGDTKFSWNVEIKEFAHPAGDKEKDKDITADTMKSTFFLAMAMFGFVFQISSLVTEKELKLRQAMSMMGLYDSAYWLSWLSWEGIMTLISSILVVLFGFIFRLKFFTKNNILVVFFVFLLFQLNMTGFSFMMSTFISKSSSATTMGFSIFIIGILTQVATQAGFPYGKGGGTLARRAWSLFPPNLLTQGLKLLTSDPDNGITWANRAKCLKTEPKCSMTINDVYIWLLGTFFVWLLLTLYFDNILPNPAGIRRSVYYFLMPGYWTGRGGNKLDEGGLCSCTGSIPPLEHTTPDDEDVLQEETAVKTQAKEGFLDPKIAVQIRGLVKAYPGTTTCVCCCKCKKTPPYHAVKGLWVNIEQDQLFCLLGPNGAGKTTTISCLTGIAPVTGGDALIHGFSIRSTSGAANIRRLIGVCPQFDILWEVLTSQEHLHLFANIKGLQPDTIDSVAMNLLSEVKLSEKAKTRAGSYSGGMKRRLSVAIALIGDPKLVILDEPTTGMDPITRRHVWDVIESAKKGRAIVLTTHSMEEADILSDRIAIMAKGRLRCIGSSIRLKSRFGTGFIANVTFIENLGQGRYDEDLDANRDAVKHFFNYHLSILPKEESKSFLTFVIPRDRERRLTEFFTALQEREKEFGIADIQLGLTTLEEVFLNIARQADLENAIAEGRMVSLTLDSGFQIEVPLGARYVAIPGKETPENPKGYMVEVYWEADDSGSLHITGHSQERPVPSSVQLRSAAPQLPRRNSLGGNQKIYGIAIDPSQISA